MDDCSLKLTITTVQKYGSTVIIKILTITPVDFFSVNAKLCEQCSYVFRSPGKSCYIGVKQTRYCFSCSGVSHWIYSNEDNPQNLYLPQQFTVIKRCVMW